MSCQRCGGDVGFLTSGPICKTCTDHVTRALATWTQHFEACIADRFLSHEEELALRAFQGQLRLTDADMAPVVPRLMRAKQLTAVLAGHLPNVAVPGVILPVGEIAHYVCGAALVLTTYATEYVRATRGSTVRIARGVSFRTSGTRGHNVTIPSNHTLPGTLVVTNRNVSFYSRQIISLPIAAIASYNYSGNTVEFSWPGRSDDSFFQVGDAEMVVATFFAARTRADQEAAPSSSRALSYDPQPAPVALPAYVDPVRKQQEDAAEAARKQQQQAETDARNAEINARNQQMQAEAAEREGRRREDLVARFGDAIAAKIVAKEVWLGETREMVIETFGHPAEVSEKVMKSKTKRVFKYFRAGGKRFDLKITLDDDEVVGWDR